jgi:hypothetical protein
MSRLRCLGPAIRLTLAAFLALCLGVRLLTPPGFMPAFGNGAVTIVPCPDAGDADLMAIASGMPAMPMPGGSHDGHESKGAIHQMCPYAAAASMVGLDTGTAALVAIALPATLPPLARELSTFQRQATRDRPPLRGPPLPA